MRRMVLAIIVVVGAIIAAIMVPGPIRHVFPVFIVWYVSGLLNIMGAMAIADLCDMRFSDLTHRRGSAKIALGMMNPLFWRLFWWSGVALVVQALSPLLLLVWYKPSIVAGVFALNMIGNIPALWRVWALRIYRRILA